MASPERQNPSRIKNIKNRTKHQLVDVTVEEEDKPNTGERTAHSNRKKTKHTNGQTKGHTRRPPQKVKSIQWKEKEEVKHFLPSQPATNLTNQQGQQNPFTAPDQSLFRRTNRDNRSLSQRQTNLYLVEMLQIIF
jgi:hypothetical protein